MNWIIFGLVIIWLGIISWFDIRKNEIPHSAWVIIPLFGAGVYRIWQGDWLFVLLAGLVATVSERERISQIIGWKEIVRIKTWFPLLFLGAIFSIQASPITALSIIGFWAAWELKWWGGADAVAAITLILIYPEITFILTFLIVHVIATIGLAIRSKVKENTVCLHKIPSIPLILFTVIPFQIIHFLA
ncbi:MAG: hypothetical protein CL609_24275 [Anaerolineaceae bacterium]|nr:hypothetical protein [Anaerolineaceae bacterium]